MLTRDLMRSRNLSQTFTVSGSRPICVAVVILMEKKAKKANNQRSGYFHRCEKTVESKFSLKHHALEFLPAPERMSNAPWFRTAPVRSSWTTYDCTELFEFSLTVRSGASEKCTKARSTVHMAFTTFPQALNLCNKKNSCEIPRKYALL